jgi:hypothetical protein
VNARSPRDVSVNGWRSASDLGLFEDAEPEPWERLVEDPDRLERAPARGGGSVFFGDGVLRDLSPAVCVFS